MGGVDISGTYSGHPISMAAARASIRELEKGESYRWMNKWCSFLAKETESIIDNMKLDAQVQSYGSIFTIYFTRKTIKNYQDLKKHNDDEAFHKFSNRMRDEGIFITPISRKRCHLSASHTSEDAKKTVKAMELSLRALKNR